MFEVRPAIKYVTNKMLKDLEQNGIQAGGFENFSFAHPIQAVQEWDSEEMVMGYINGKMHFPFYSLSVIKMTFYFVRSICFFIVLKNNATNIFGTDEGDKGGEEEENDYIQGEDNERDLGQDADVDNEENDAFQSKEDEVENGIGVNQGYDDVNPNDAQLLIDTISTQPDTNDDTQKNNFIVEQVIFFN